MWRNAMSPLTTRLRFYLCGLAIRPLLKEALARGQTFDELLPKAVNAYRQLPELYKKMREDLKGQGVGK